MFTGNLVNGSSRWLNKNVLRSDKLDEELVELEELIVGDKESLVLNAVFDYVDSGVGQAVKLALNLTAVLKSSVSWLELQFLDIGSEGFVEDTLFVEEVKLRVNLVNNDVNIGIILLNLNDLVEEDGVVSEIRTFQFLSLDVKSSDLDDFELVLGNIGVHKDVFVSGGFILKKSVVNQGVVTFNLLVD